MNTLTQKQNNKKELQTPHSYTLDELPNASIIKKYSSDEIRNFIKHLNEEGDLGHAMINFNKILSKIPYSKAIKNKAIEEKLTEQVSSMLCGLEVETHVVLMGSVDKKYSGMAKELSSQIIDEYQCTTHAEKMLVETIVNAFIQNLENSRRFNGCIKSNEFISSELTQYLAILGKQIDRSHRQFLSSLSMLKQLKQPQMEINIKTNNAFVANNQQINANPTKS